MKLIAKLLTATLSGPAPQDMTFELLLENDGSKPAQICGKDIPWGNALGFHGFGVTFAGPSMQKPRSAYRPYNPEWGAPAPPYLVQYRAQHEVNLAPGKNIKVQIKACLLPRFSSNGGTQAMLNALANPDKADPATLGLLAFETSCSELKKELPKGPDALYGRSVILLPPAEYDVTFSYVEHEGYGFTPAQPQQLAAPPLKLRLP